MKIAYSKNFVKQAKKLDASVRARLMASIKIFNENPLHPVLRNHGLKGKYKGYRSIDVTRDVRALYLQGEKQVVFDQVGTHSQLYG